MPRERQIVAIVLAALVAGAILGFAIGQSREIAEPVGAGVTDSAPTGAAETTSTTSTTSTSTTSILTTTVAPPPPEMIEVVVPVAVVASPPDAERALEIAATLDLDLPSTCPLPLDTPRLLANAPREYRAGVHRGIDFMCEGLGFEATAAADGVVVFARDGFVDASTPARDGVLDIAIDLGHTPTWTLAMMYGRFVVVDHGEVDGVGHVVTLYAHLDEVAPEMVEGSTVVRGQLVGTIGNSGTSHAARGSDDALHLHWEIYIDDVFLAAALDEDDTRAVYAELFG